MKTNACFKVAVAVMLGSLAGGAVGKATADDCVALGGILNAGECQLAASVSRNGLFTLDETLRVLSTGRIDAASATITLRIKGSLIMEVPTTTSGSQIVADVTGAGSLAGTINIETTQDIILRGNGTRGGRISAEQSAGSCTIGGGGVINLTAGGNVKTEDGSVISVDAKCPAGAINITAAGFVDIDGLVSSESTLSGTGGLQKPGGGPIWIKAGCELLVSDTGIVRSKGRDPGADLVHLEACTVVIDGLVASTGPGHAVPNNPANHCNSTSRPGKNPNATACVEIFAASTVLIDARAPHNGEVSADASGNTRGGASWIDIFAGGDIVIAGLSTGDYAVHANRSGSMDVGGVVTIKSVGGSIATSGRAVQANATASGSDGGTVEIEAGGPGSPGGDLTLGNASIEARGDAAGNGAAGGHISVRARNGRLTGTASGELDATGPGGTVTAQACLGVAYAGTVIPSLTTLAAACGGSVGLPAYVNDTVSFPTCSPVGRNSISGKKFEQIGNQSVPLDGVTIFIDANNNQMLDGNEVSTVTAGGGMYSFPSVAAGSVAVCEVVPVGFDPVGPICQMVTVNICLDPPVVNFTNRRRATPTPTPTPTLTATGVLTPTPTPTQTPTPTFTSTPSATVPNLFIPCPEDILATVTKIVSTTLVGGNVYTTVQAAVNAAVLGDTIGVFSNTTENVVINLGFALKITQCTTAKVTAANNADPVFTIDGLGPIEILGLDAQGGSVGFLVKTTKHAIRGVRATFSQIGVEVRGNSNYVTLNRVDSNTVAGIKLSGSFNEVRGGTLSGNGIGIHIAATGTFNTLNGNVVGMSAGDGFKIDGSQNILRSLRSLQNGGNGYSLAGGSNSLRASDGTSNLGAGVKVGGMNNLIRDEKVTGSALCEYDVSGAGTNDGGGSNYANGVRFTNIEMLGCFE